MTKTKTSNFFFFVSKTLSYFTFNKTYRPIAFWLFLTFNSKILPFYIHCQMKIDNLTLSWVETTPLHGNRLVIQLGLT